MSGLLSEDRLSFKYTLRVYSCFLLQMTQLLTFLEKGESPAVQQEARITYVF